MIFVALTLMATGVMGGLLGYKLFKVMLPLIGLIIGSTIGFVGVQSVFGAGVVSTTMAIFAAMAVGLDNEGNRQDHGAAELPAQHLPRPLIRDVPAGALPPGSRGSGVTKPTFVAARR